MTLLIKNVRVLCGAKDYGESADVFIVGDRISAVGQLPQKDADMVLDGQGAYLSPGFIDCGSTADHYLDIFENPAQGNLLSQGITTIIGGQCGFSLAPLLYGRLDMIRKWADTDKVNINWHTMAEFFANLKKTKLGVNFGTLTGHLTIRQEILGDAERELSGGEVAVMKKIISESLAQGSAGVSFGLEYAHGKKVPQKEIKMVSSLVGEAGGIVAMHLRRRDEEIFPAYEEAKEIAATSAPVLISHFSPRSDFKKEYEKVLLDISSLKEDAPLYFTIRPFEQNIVPLYFLLPKWAQKGSLEEMLKGVKDDWLFSRVKKDLPAYDPASIVIHKAVKNPAIEGKSLAELMELYGISDAAECLRKIMITTGLRGTVGIGELDPQLLVEAWKNPRSIIATFAPRIPEFNSTLMHFLDRVEKENILPLEEAVRKITSAPAKIFGFSKRGEVREGNIADLAIWKGGEVKFTILSGNVAYRPGEKSELFGTALIRTKNGF